MRESTIELLRCPSGCEAALDVIEPRGVEGRIVEGILRCPGCSRRYRIERGIARMLPGGLEASEQSSPSTDQVEMERKRSEMAARDAQVDDYDRMRGLALFSKIEIPVTLNRLGLRFDDLLLEAGCGTGRMTPQFSARCRSQIAMDFSWESLKVCERKIVAAGIKNVDLIQADVCALPLRSDRFDRVVSCQVLEHIPTPESRARMISELARVARVSGTVVISAYQHSLFTRLFDKKEGEHAGGIYYYRFHRGELKALLSQRLQVETMTGALVYHYLARCVKSAKVG